MYKGFMAQSRTVNSCGITKETNIEFSIFFFSEECAKQVNPRDFSPKRTIKYLQVKYLQLVF